MRKPKSIWDNETHKIFCGFKIKIDQQIQVRLILLLLINQKKRTCHVPEDLKVKKKNEKIDKYLHLGS